MHPLLFQYKYVAVYSYGAMLALAFLFSVWVASRRAERAGISSQVIVDLCLWVLIFSIIGARLFYVLSNWDYYRFHLIEILLIQKGGLIYYGGLLFGALSAVFFIRLKKLNLFEVSDLLAPSISLGQSFGRIGCFLNGCCFGTLTHLPWGVQFPEKSAAALEYGPLHLVHPTQLYSAGVNFLIFVFLLYLDKKKKFKGQTFALYLILYGIARFSLEFLRGDNPPFFVFLTLSQFISLLCLGIGCWLFFFLRRRARVQTA